MNDLIAVLALWLSVTFGLPEIDEYPQVRFKLPAELTLIRYGETLATAGADVVAVYHDSSKAIILRKGWDSRKPADVSALVHELVHHLQNLAGLQYSCPEAREKLAYQAQARWLSMFDMDLTEFQIDPMTLKLRTSCLSP